jgi:lipopolysaccharide biosynthesis regulator YciM
VDQEILLAALLALLLGITLGKAWERYKLRDGRIVDRRRLRQTPHYILGLNFLADNRIDQAIDELAQAATTDPQGVEIQLVLGNLYRQKGQVTRAITVHQALLTRNTLSALERACVLLSLGFDFRHAGFVDRAVEAFQQVLEVDPKNRYALANLQKLLEDQQEWAEAIDVRARIMRVDGEQRREDEAILGFLHNALGEQHHRAGQLAEAGRDFTRAIDACPRTTPAHLNLGDLRYEQGQLAEAIAAWEELAREHPDRAYLVFERLERAYGESGGAWRFVDLCQRLIATNPHDWRARLALSRHYAAAGEPREALALLFDALPFNPHGLAIHQEIWQALALLRLDPALARRYVELTRATVFYLDPHVCTRCRYRSTELLWKCPQCHEWNTFVEERIAPLREAPPELAAAE